MDLERVAPPLRERLGPEATAGLVALLLQTRKEMTADVISIAGDRFERRLAEETSSLRVDMAQGFGTLRQELTQGLAGLRQELHAGIAGLRQEMVEGITGVRQEMREGVAGLRQEMLDGNAQLRQEIAAGDASLRQEILSQRFEILKWVFIFWVGQFFAVASVLAVVIRFLGR